MGVDLTGDWGGAFRALDRLANNVKDETSRKIAKGTAQVERVVLDHMDSQDMGWEPLSDAYAKTKERKGQSPDILRADNTMYQNITTHQSDAWTGMVGVKRGVRTRDGEDITDIALIHEQPDDDGTVIPARKLWEPTFEEMREELGEDIIGGIVGMVKK